MMVIRILVFVSMYSTVAWATPTDEELLPITIPAADYTTTRLATQLAGACDLVSKPIAGPASEFTTGPLHALESRRTATPKAPIDGPSSAALQGLRAACAAIRGTERFTDEILRSLRNFRDDPKSADLVRTTLDRAKADKQSPLDVSTLTSAGGYLDTLVHGIAQFIYDRAKAEAIAYLAERLKALICAPERKPFFRNVCVAFDELDTTTSLPSIGSYLIEAARRDVQRLPDTLLVYALDASTTPAAHDGKRAAGATCTNLAVCEPVVGARVALAFYDEVRGGRDPLDIARALHRVELTPLLRAQAPTTTRAIQLASSVIDAVLRQAGWERLTLKTPELPFYAMSVVLTVESITARWDQPWKVSTDALDRAQALQTIIAIILHSGELRTRIHDIASARAAASVAPAGGDIEDGAKAAPPAAKATGRDAVVAATSALQLVLQAAGELSDSLGISSSALSRVTTVVRLGELLARGDTTPALAVEVSNLFVGLLGTRSPGPFTAVVSKAVPFVTQLAAATSADEVAKVLEAAAAPIGTYREKSKKRMTTINAFVGVAGGGERVSNAPDAAQFGAFAPIGVHVSWPWGGNWGVLLSVVNLGSLVSERFDEDASSTVAVDSTQSDDVKKLFSPGVFATKSFGDSPFSIGAGLQFVPSARDVTTTTMTELGETTTSTNRRPALQWMVFVAIDVSIFPL